AFNDACNKTDGMENNYIPQRNIVVSSMSDDSEVDDLKPSVGGTVFKGAPGDNNITITISFDDKTELGSLRWNNAIGIPGAPDVNLKIFTVSDGVTTQLDVDGVD
ncbi:unnamed protein product, partial [Owenia fusiformis]